MKLYYSVTSPYSRKVFVLACMLGLAEDIRLEVGSSLAPNTDLPTVNPLGKVPTLVSRDGRAIFDSPVIVEYLHDLAGVKREGESYLRQLQIQAVADGIMDAAVNMVMEARRPDAEISAYWMDRWQKSIERSVTYLEAQGVECLGEWNFGTVAVVCALDYLGFRLPEIAWQGAAPKLSAWFEKARLNPDIVATDPRANA